MNYLDIERMIDRNGISLVMEKIAEIATMKAAHLRTNWHDEAMAKRWESVANHMAMFRQFDDL